MNAPPMSLANGIEMPRRMTVASSSDLVTFAPMEELAAVCVALYQLWERTAWSLWQQKGRPWRVRGVGFVISGTRTCRSRRSWRSCVLDARMLIRCGFGLDLSGGLRRGDPPRLARPNPLPQVLEVAGAAHKPLGVATDCWPWNIGPRVFGFLAPSPVTGPFLP